MNARDRANGRAVPAPPAIPTIQVDLAADPLTGQWTATIVAFGAFGRGPTPGMAVDDVLSDLDARIAAIDALAAAGSLTASWKDRRQAMITARRIVQVAEREGMGPNAEA